MIEIETEIETVCQTCGDAFTPDHADYVAGRWRTCSACRDRTARLDDLRQAPPQPLSRQRDRDGPDRHHGPLPAPKRAHGAHSAPPTHSWDHRSKG